MWRCLLAFLVLFWSTSARADVIDYVKKADPSFKWNLRKTAKTSVGTVYDIQIVSQTWQGIVWEHDLQVILPKDVKPTSTMLLWNTGGKPGVASAALALDLAGKTQAPVAFLFGIPNQPLFEGKKEDALIAETFVRYLKDKNDDWPLLFPMVKSLVRAMDALQEFARKEWKIEVNDCVVTGASKRGWTSWLTAVADRRVKAVAPLVIDTLNMRAQLPHQLESYGAYSEMIADYTKRSLVPMPDTPEAKKLWAMVDPWVYRKRLTMPKMIINGTNDPYWTQDALNLYWNDLEGDKWVLYVPNAGHNLRQKREGGKEDTSRAISTLAAFARHQITGKAMPKLAWKHSGEKDVYRLEVESTPAPKAAQLWVADAPTRDFRKATWKEHEARRDGRMVTGEVKEPETGYRVFMGECEYEIDGLSYYLSTQVRIVGKGAK